MKATEVKNRIETIQEEQWTKVIGPKKGWFDIRPFESLELQRSDRPLCKKGFCFLLQTDDSWAALVPASAPLYNDCLYDNFRQDRADFN